jgi:cell division septation protein DedD
MMAPEAPGGGGAREVRLEGAGLVVSAVVLVGLLAGAFALGRTTARPGTPPPGGSTSAASAGGDTETSDAPEKVTFFDTASGGGKEAEPKREASAKLSDGPAPPPVAVSEGPWFVQVFVGRDRSAAEEVVHSLRAKGYAVRTEAVSEGGSGSLYKVRVGGYASRDQAEAGAVKLHQDGEASTWVVRVGG